MKKIAYVLSSFVVVVGLMMFSAGCEQKAGVSEQKPAAKSCDMKDKKKGEKHHWKKDKKACMPKTTEKECPPKPGK